MVQVGRGYHARFLKAGCSGRPKRDGRLRWRRQQQGRLCILEPESCRSAFRLNSPAQGWWRHSLAVDGPAQRPASGALGGPPSCLKMWFQPSRRAIPAGRCRRSGRTGCSSCSTSNLKPMQPAHEAFPGGGTVSCSVAISRDQPGQRNSRRGLLADTLQGAGLLPHCGIATATALRTETWSTYRRAELFNNRACSSMPRLTNCLYAAVSQ